MQRKFFIVQSSFASRDTFVTTKRLPFHWKTLILMNIMFEVISPRRLFGGESGIELIFAYPIPLTANDYPKLWARKVIRRNLKASTIKHTNNYVLVMIFNTRIHRVTIVPHPRFWLHA